jgi:AraC-like DNA-binding protein
MISVKYLKYCSKRDDVPFKVSGAGVRESMLPGIVDRPLGTNDRLLMFFYDPVFIKEEGRVTAFPANTLKIWKDSEGHYYGNPEQKWTHSWLHFHGEFAEKILNINGLGSFGAMSFSGIDDLEMFIYQIYREITEQIRPDEVVLQNLFECMVRRIKRNFGENSGYEPARMKKVREFLLQYPEKKIRLKELAKKIGLSVPHLCYEFKKTYGKSPIDYQIEKRLENAEYYLRDYNLSVSEIAERCGYSDIYQFSRAFKNKFLLSPANYRNKYLS